MKPAFEIFLRGRGGLHDVHIILVKALLNIMMIDYKVGREG